ncbi:MAG: methyltransferase domain-containing protein [Patescibacteria group bacterium]
MPVETKIYDNRFFKNTIKLETKSAKAVVDILLKYFQPQTVIDIGCGAGIYLKEFAKKGLKVIGYDGSPAALAESMIDKIKLHDFCKPLKINEKYDLCLCIEVAEHLPEKCSNTLINTLTNLSSLIVFTAATPGQGPRSIGHINEQPHYYWIKKFKNKGFSYERGFSKIIRKEMEKKNVVWWIVKNLIIFRRQTTVNRK